VKEILREVTWIAVFLSAIVYFVFIGWFGKKIGSKLALSSLIGTLVIVFFSFLFNLHKIVHPIWPVTMYVFVITGIGACVSKKR